MDGVLRQCAWGLLVVTAAACGDGANHADVATPCPTDLAQSEMFATDDSSVPVDMEAATPADLSCGALDCDPLHLVARKSGTEAWLNDVIFDGTRYVVAGTDNTLVFSPDGGAWTVKHPVNNLGAPGWPWIQSIAHAGRWYVMAGWPYPEQVAFSLDATVWAFNSDLRILGVQVYRIQSTTRDLLAFCARGLVYSTHDLEGWTSGQGGLTSGLSDPLLAGVWTGAQYVAVGRAGHVATSPDAVTWTERPQARIAALDVPGRWFDFVDVGWNGMLLVALGRSLGATMTSSDGVRWERIPAPGDPTLSMRRLAWDGRRWLAVGGTQRLSSAEGFVLTSIDGKIWRLGARTRQRLNAITTDGPATVIVGDTGAIHEVQR